jgi:hypothetical protein
LIVLAAITSQNTARNANTKYHHQYNHCMLHNPTSKILLHTNNQALNRQTNLNFLFLLKLKLPHIQIITCAHFVATGINQVCHKIHKPKNRSSCHRVHREHRES